MTADDFTCICGEKLPHQERQSDFKCPHCGRVYNYQGRFLWREHPGNDLPGSTDTVPGGVDRRADDQDAAVEQAFEAGTLPEEPRRQTDEEIAAEALVAEDAAIAALEEDRKRRKK